MQCILKCQLHIINNKKSGNYVGFCDYGKELIMCSDPDTPATDATVFMLVGLKEYWKTPIGYVRNNKMKGGDIASFVEKILEFSLANGIYIKSITFNHAGENLSAAKSRGCEFGHEVDEFLTHF